MKKAIFINFIVGLLLIANLGWTAKKPCSTTSETRSAIKGYLVLEVQGSQAMAQYLLSEIHKIKSSLLPNESIEITGNAYLLVLTKNTVRIETVDSVGDPSVNKGVIVSEHSLCEFENQLIEYKHNLK